MMFEGVKIPKNIDSPIKEAIFEIRFSGNLPGEALYGILYDIFKDFPHKETHALPIMQIPQQMREIDPNLRYQPYYRATNKNFALAVGPRSVIFSALEPYSGWTDWTNFFYPKIDFIREKDIIQTVERIGLRTLDVFNGNIFDSINAGLTIDNKIINKSPTSFFTEFDQNNTHIVLNIGNAANVNGLPTKNSLIDIDCICQFNSDASSFFDSYKSILEKAHLTNKQVFFGLLKQDLLASLNPEW
jgi:uncharacterized protein (TIGR04255 family)